MRSLSATSVRKLEDIRDASVADGAHFDAAVTDFAATAVDRFGLDAAWSEPLRAAYLTAYILGCSTAGEIVDTQVTDGSLVATAIQFDHTQVQGNYIQMATAETSIKW